MSNKMNSIWLKKATTRPLTEDTEFLVCLYSYRGESPKQIAYNLSRSEYQVKKILKEAKASGRYDEHISRHLEHLANDIPHGPVKTEFRLCAKKKNR